MAKKIRRIRSKRRSNNVPEYASCSVKRTITATAGQPFVVNTMYEAHNIQLADYVRAATIGAGYQFFRIKKVAITYKIGYDTYQAGAGAATRPNFYYMIDKGQTIPLTVSLESLKLMGARPHVVDNKPLTVSWKPAVLTEDATTVGPSGPSQYKISPWLNTNQANLGAFVPSQIAHNGIYWYCQMDATGGVGYNYSAEMEVQFEFKKPLWTLNPSSVNATGIAYAQYNSSPDGIVGGADEDLSGNSIVHA